MISNEHKGHKKHADLGRPSLGSFGRNEWAIVGAPCITIKILAGRVIEALSAKYKCAYVDTSHNDEIVVLPGRLGSGASIEYTDQLNFVQLNYKAAFNAFKLKETFSQVDLVLANGNHHQAKAQVVIINESKRASLQKRIAQLTDVQLILLADGVSDIFDFVKEQVPAWDKLPVYHLDETAKIIAFFEAKMQQAVPALNGLVLAGGKSERMGFDKGAVLHSGTIWPICLKVFAKTFLYRAGRTSKQRSINNINAFPILLPDWGPLGAYYQPLGSDRTMHGWLWLVIYLY